MPKYLDDDKDFDPLAPFLSDDGWFYENAQGKFANRRAKHWGNQYLEKFDRAILAYEHVHDGEPAPLLREARRKWLEACQQLVLEDLAGITGFKGSDGQVVSHKKLNREATAKKVYERLVGQIALEEQRERAGSFGHRLSQSTYGRGA